MYPIGAGKDDIAQIDAILAKFPGPVTLHITRNRRLLGLLVTACATAFCIWLWMSGPRGRGAYHAIMQPLALLVFSGLTIRAVILLLVPACANLTLDADGFRINHVFHRIERSWRHVSGFRAETRNLWRYGLHRVVMYDVLDSGGARRGAKQKPVPEFYGRGCRAKRSPP